MANAMHKAQLASVEVGGFGSAVLAGAVYTGTLATIVDYVTHAAVDSFLQKGLRVLRSISRGSVMNMRKIQKKRIACGTGKQSSRGLQQLLRLTPWTPERDRT